MLDVVPPKVARSPDGRLTPVPPEKPKPMARLVFSFSMMQVSAPLHASSTRLKMYAVAQLHVDGGAHRMPSVWFAV